MLRGIDVSHYQGTVDWGALKKQYGLTWGAAKVTEAEGGKDSEFLANWRNLKAAGLVRVGYHFAHPDNDPTDDANAFLAYVNAAGGFGPEDIACMDMEANQLNLPMLTVRDWLAKWADIVTKATGRKPFLYCGSGYIRNNSTLNLRSHYAAWWYPEYPSAYDGKTAWPDAITGYPTQNNWGSGPDIWQFSQSFGGGNRDANIANMTLADLKTRGSNSTPGTSTGELTMADVQSILAYQKACTIQIQDNTRQHSNRVITEVGKIVQKYAVAVNAFTRQTDSTTDTERQAELDKLQANLTADVAAALDNQPATMADPGQ
ncbi:MAG TPA: glycoside hydrolase family 25 protein [Mycobacterium sp.]|jgi:GH25 family lysozyme M1 (1,4-beta-N-acetylmuramidase)|uniref:glycoside hydrolase family 25 protein n=1 Tax=Mycobacterium sp. TaxID=1785 RepID=UPI002F40E31A